MSIPDDIPSLDVHADNQKKAEEFLQALTELSQRFGLIVDSCGDCESMWITSIDRRTTFLTSVDWSETEGNYKHG